MFGLGKPRTKFGKWLDRNRIPQQEFVDASGVSKSTISRLATEDDAEPTVKNYRKIDKAIKSYDARMSAEDFWG